MYCIFITWSMPRCPPILELLDRRKPQLFPHFCVLKIAVFNPFLDWYPNFFTSLGNWIFFSFSFDKWYINVTLTLGPQFRLFLNQNPFPYLLKHHKTCCSRWSVNPTWRTSKIMKMTADQNHCFSSFQWAIDLNIVFKHETIFTLINLTLWSILDTKIHAFDAYLKATNDQPRFRAVLIMWSIFST